VEVKVGWGERMFYEEARQAVAEQQKAEQSKASK